MPESLGWIMVAGENIVIELEEKRSRKCIQPSGERSRAHDDDPHVARR